MQERLLQLTQQIEELTKWKEETTRKQFSYPIDQVSKSIIDINHLVATGKVTTPPAYDTVIEVKFKDSIYWISAKLDQ